MVPAAATLSRPASILSGGLGVVRLGVDAVWMLRDAHRSESGQASAEYALIIGAIALACLVAVIFPAALSEDSLTRAWIRPATECTLRAARRGSRAEHR